MNSIFHYLRSSLSYLNYSFDCNKIKFLFQSIFIFIFVIFPIKIMEGKERIEKKIETRNERFLGSRSRKRQRLILVPRVFKNCLEIYGKYLLGYGCVVTQKHAFVTDLVMEELPSTLVIFQPRFLFFYMT